MTKLLEKAVEEISKLPDKEQNEIAQLIFDELNDENLWDENFAKSQDVLSKLADEAANEYDGNKTKDLDL